MRHRTAHPSRTGRGAEAANFIANRQRLTHVEIINGLADIGFRCEDLFILAQRRTPSVPASHHRQLHCRKAHSYLLIFVKGLDRIWNGPQAAPR